MRKLCKHLLVLAVIICCVVGVAINAQAEEIIDSGTCGNDLTWTLDNSGTLTISGTGAMANYSSSNVPWYTYRNSIESIIMSDGITSIADHAFYYCTRLESVTIPNSVTSIGAFAFYESSLQSITIPDSVTSIGEYAFAYCIYLKKLTIPYGVTSISNGAFHRSGIQSITIPNSVTSIGVHAFSGSFLTSIIIPNSVTQIEENAFFNCSNLRKVTYCGTEEQWRQISLDSNNAPLATATRIYHNWDLSSCTETKSCTICGVITTGHAWLGATCTEPEICSLCGATEGDVCHNVHYGICEYCQHYGTCGQDLIWTLNAGTLTIFGSGAMNDYGGTGDDEWYDDWDNSPWQAVATDIKTVVIKKGVTTIGCEAFYGLDNLTSVTIGDSVTSIGSSAFSDCSSLTSVTIGDSVTSIESSAFSGCSSLTSVTIPDSVISIDRYAFSSCASLTSVTIPDSVTSIGSSAFAYCRSLTSVTIGDSVTSIESSAFYGCSSLTSIAIPDSIISIGYSAFSGCSNLTSITIPDSVTSIGRCAFSSCASLTGIWVDTENKNFSSDEYGVLFNKDKTTLIAAPGALQAYSIPNGVTSIGEGAFSGCSSLTSINIPDSVAGIEYGAFEYCKSLTSITIGNGVTDIGYYAFRGCSSLTSITIPDSVTSIGVYAFSSCTSLIGITIPDSVTSIANYAFDKCSSLSHVAFTGSISQWIRISIGTNNTYLTYAFRHYETSFTKVDNCVSEGVYCPVCQEFITEIRKEGGTHNYESVVTPPTAIKEGYTTHTCSVCGDSYTDSTVPAVGIGQLAFSGASLSLHNDLSINLYADANLFIEDAYTAPYVVCEFGYKTMTITEYEVVDGQYVFTCDGISPSQIGDTVYVTLHATLNGEAYTAEKEYGVAAYCYNMLAKTEDSELKTLLVDLLNYGAAAQEYASYKNGTLCNADLTEEQRSWGTQTVPAVSSVLNTKYATVENAKAKWKGAYLYLKNNVSMRARFAAESIEGLSVKATIGDNTYVITEFEADAANPGSYFVYFDQINASQMRETVYLTVCEGDTAVSNTVTYSVESYVAGKLNDSNVKLANLVASIIKYGDAAYNLNH